MLQTDANKFFLFISVISFIFGLLINKNLIKN